MTELPAELPQAPLEVQDSEPGSGALAEGPVEAPVAVEADEAGHIGEPADALLFAQQIPTGVAAETSLAMVLGSSKSEVIAIVKTYTPAAGTPASPDYTATVNGQACHVYNHPDTTIEMGRFAYFDFADGSAVVLVTVAASIAATVTSATVYPATAGVAATVFDAHTVRVEFGPTGTPVNVSLQINAVDDKPLHIFAGPIEAFPPATDPRIYAYYREGVTYTAPASGTVDGITSASEVVIPAGKIVVVEGGAIVKAKFRIGPATASTAGHADGAQVLGRGIVDATGILTGTAYGRSFKCYKSKSVLVNGPIFLNRQTWGFRVFGATGTQPTERVVIRNVKILNGATATNSTPDGLDILASKWVQIDGCFIQSIDDAIAIKNEKDQMDGLWSGNVDQIDIRNIVISQGPNGNGLEIGWETGGYATNTAHSITNVVYTNIDIVRKKAKDTASRRAGIGIHAADGTGSAHGAPGKSTVSGIRYNGVRIWRCEQAYFHFWTANAGNRIDDVYLEDVQVLDPKGAALPSYAQGYPNGLIGARVPVTFENLRYGNTLILSRAAANMQVSNATVRFIPSVGLGTGLEGSGTSIGPADG